MGFETPSKQNKPEPEGNLEEILEGARRRTAERAETERKEREEREQKEAEERREKEEEQRELAEEKARQEEALRKQAEEERQRKIEAVRQEAIEREKEKMETREKLHGDTERAEVEAYQVRTLAELLRLRRLEHGGKISSASGELKKRTKEGFKEIQPDRKDYEDALEMHKVIFKPESLSPEEREEIEGLPQTYKFMAWITKKAIEREANQLMEMESGIEEKDKTDMMDGV